MFDIAKVTVFLMGARPARRGSLVYDGAIAEKTRNRPGGKVLVSIPGPESQPPPLRQTQPLSI
jgi:hypothetical protein